MSDFKEVVDALLQRTGAASMTEVIRRSLAVYDTLENLKAEGWAIVARKQAKEKLICII